MVLFFLSPFSPSLYVYLLQTDFNELIDRNREERLINVIHSGISSKIEFHLTFLDGDPEEKLVPDVLPAVLSPPPSLCFSSEL